MLVLQFVVCTVKEDEFRSNSTRHPSSLPPHLTWHSPRQAFFKKLKSCVYSKFEYGFNSISPKIFFVPKSFPPFPPPSLHPTPPTATHQLPPPPVRPSPASIHRQAPTVQLRGLQRPSTVPPRLAKPNHHHRRRPIPISFSIHDDPPPSLPTVQIRRAQPSKVEANKASKKLLWYNKQLNRDFRLMVL
ncbi:extensin-like [Alnus glutinosa]|uniref:extensin-like n=1 Tax=Alnus glutinosa TaxID=3517 RepID=UPI002D7A2371|nr:extensin-like [Alnus glutinosa]